LYFTLLVVGPPGRRYPMELVAPPFSFFLPIPARPWSAQRSCSRRVFWGNVRRRPSILGPLVILFHRFPASSIRVLLSDSSSSPPGCQQCAVVYQHFFLIHSLPMIEEEHLCLFCLLAYPFEVRRRRRQRRALGFYHRSDGR